MYSRYFGLNEKPFSITPDPRYLFMSERHGEALAHLVYGVTESGGFMQLTGEVGTGKTTLVRTLLLNRMPSNADVAVVLNPQLSSIEFLQTICEELEVELPDEKDSVKALIDTLNRHLLSAHAEGRRIIVVVDEAQNLAPDVLEQVRLLTNLETARQKLLQIILIGQPELREVLARNDLRQLAQRITGRYHLEPLTRDETALYIEHRLKVAGALGEVFEPGAKKEVYRISQGVPRLINVICDRALLGAYGAEQRKVTRRMVMRAAAEVTGSDVKPALPTWVLPLAAGVAVAILGISLYSALGPFGSTPAPLVVAEAPIAETEPEPELRAVESTATHPVESNEEGPSLNQQLALAEELTTREAAIANLFSLWGLSYVADGRDGCEQASALGYSCINQRGSLNGLKQFDRPAILRLIDEAGATHHVVLTQIVDDTAHLSISGVDVEHAVDDVSNLWFGQYLLLWQPPNGIVRSLAPGVRGPNVLWLRQSLAGIDPVYLTSRPNSDEYDAELTERVRLFQRDHRLNVDGLAGFQTQIIVQSMLAPGSAPRLSSLVVAE